MSFVYEMVGEENKELWESIGWKDWFENKRQFYEDGYWSVDKDNCIYLVSVGNYIDGPAYYDFSYKNRIVRMDVVEVVRGDRKIGLSFTWKVKRIRIPKSIWAERKEIIIQIRKAFSIVRNWCPIECVKEISVEILCDPTCVEVDYNGR